LVTWGRGPPDSLLSYPKTSRFTLPGMRLRRTQRPLNREETEQAVHELGWWHHHFELPNGVRTGDDSTAGYDPAERWEPIAPHLPDDLEGASVLDVGGNSGYFGLQMLLRGAGRCVLVEPVEQFAAQARFVYSQFGVDAEIVAEDIHTYCVTRDEHFDYVLLLGVLYHLRYPLLVLDRLAEMTRRQLFLQSHLVGPQVSHEPWADAGPEDVVADDFPRLSFVEGRYRGDVTNWWLPNYTALAALARSAGLRILARPTRRGGVERPSRRNLSKAQLNRDQRRGRSANQA
jgi:tRNA (mo5U34)-methyltransferase